MLKNHRLAKHIADANFGEIRRQLTYKAELYGNVLHVVDRFFPSSKQCSGCGNINVELTLTDRTYMCTRCGMVKNRDLNAAENLNRAGLAQIHASASVPHVTEATSMGEAGSERGAMITIAHF